MNRIKAMSFLLIFLFTINSFLSGCTMGFYIGKNHDVQSAERYVDVYLTDIRKGDYVILYLAGGTEKRGKVKSVHKNEDISIYMIDNKDNYIRYDTVKNVYKWDQITGAKKLVIGYQGRVDGLYWGTLAQIGFLFLVFVLPFMY